MPPATPADQPQDDLLPVIPANLSELSDDELVDLYNEIQDVVTRCSEGDAETIGDRTPAQIIAALTVAADTAEAIRGEQSSRDLASTENAATIAELAKRALGADPLDPEAAGDEEPEGAEDDPAADEEPAAGTPAAEPIAASARRQARPVARSGHARPKVQADPKRRASLVASGDVPGRSAGQTITQEDVPGMLLDKFRATGMPSSGEIKYPVAQIRAAYPDDRILTRDDEERNTSLIEAVVGEEALTASGALCAPVEPYYGLESLAETMRPVRDMFPRFGADRGGIAFHTPPKLSDITTAVGTVTAALNALGGSWATKTCQRLPCPTRTTVLVDSIYHCLTVDNLGSRAWPELLKQFTDTMMAGYARTAETKLLDAINASSTQVTGAAVGGAVNTLFEEVLRLAAGIRSRNRMQRDRVVRAILPQWAADLLVADVVRSQFGRFDISVADVLTLLRSFNVEVTLTPDGPTGAGQVFGTQGAGAINVWPATMKWFMFPEGSYLWLDGGVLDLGIVRDSTLNSTNDFQEFGEGWENLAFIGLESFAITTTLCASGTVTAPAAVSCP